MSWKTVRDLYPEGSRRRFLADLRSGKLVRDAARSAGIPVSSLYVLRERDAQFADAWQAAAEVGKLRRRPAWTETFLDLLAAGRLAKEAAGELQRSLSLFYAWRQRDVVFARRWRQARRQGRARRQTWREPLLRAVEAGLTALEAYTQVGVSADRAIRARRRDRSFRRAWALARRKGRQKQHAEEQHT